MKKILLYFSILLGATSLVSCEEDLDIWDSETLEYSGRFVYQVLDKDGNLLADYGANSNQEIQIFNTAANKSNEVWLQDMCGKEVICGYAMKVKLFLDGNSSSFASKSLNYDDIPENQAAIDEVVDYINSNVKATALDQQTFLGKVCLKAAVESGSIVKGGATTHGGNISDAITMKFRLFYGTVFVKNYQLPEKQWSKPGVPEFAWEFDHVEYDNTLDDACIVKGYRYTGFPEDAL